MSGNFAKPPTRGEGGEVEMPLIYEAAGLPQKYLNETFAMEYVLPCVATTFSDGEVTRVFPPSDDPVVRQHFGETSYEQGTFGPRLRQLIEGDDIRLQHQVDGLIRFSATVFAHHVVSGVEQIPTHRNVDILPALVDSAEGADSQVAWLGAASLSLRDVTKPALEFDHHAVALDAQPSVVIDYGPGLQGRFHIERQLADMQSGKKPYAYLPICKGPFINEFLQQYWVARLGNNPQMARRVFGTIYIGREDGMAAATTEFVAMQTQHAGSSEMADVVVASAVHRASYDEVGTGIANAHKLLKPDGTLLVRAPKASSEGSVPAEAMVDMALQAGFSRDRAQFFDVTTGAGVTQHNVQTLSAVFRK